VPQLFWAKRRFSYADYAPYQDRLQLLLFANPTRYAEFIMVSTKADNPGVGDDYVGVPTQEMLAAFDDFEPVAEHELPKEIDALLIADTTKEPFKSRFRSRGS
jgi:hypothetical protein